MAVDDEDLPRSVPTGPRAVPDTPRVRFTKGAPRRTIRSKPYEVLSSDRVNFSLAHFS